MVGASPGDPEQGRLSQWRHRDLRCCPQHPYSKDSEQTFHTSCYPPDFSSLDAVVWHCRRIHSPSSGLRLPEPCQNLANAMVEDSNFVVRQFTGTFRQNAVFRRSIGEKRAKTRQALRIDKQTGINTTGLGRSPSGRFPCNANQQATEIVTTTVTVTVTMTDMTPERDQGWKTKYCRTEPTAMVKSGPEVEGLKLEAERAEGCCALLVPPETSGDRDRTEGNPCQFMSAPC